MVPGAVQYVGREILNHSRLLHPHIVKFHEVFLTPDYLAIVMEFAGGGDMFQYVKARGGLEVGICCFLPLFAACLPGRTKWEEELLLVVSFQFVTEGNLTTGITKGHT